uniref:hemagglutinin repeat-containing protein n=1 Tax=Snodgrassella alvi TaxID=1196083 RepID=UPI001C557662|nr:hemagglutinin repeat-containing protein [Snodgrassella alvi]
MDNSEQGKIIAGKQAVIHTAAFDNNSGSIDADSLELSADSVNNAGGAIRVNQQLKAQINRNLNNQNGIFGSGADLLLNSEGESLLAVDNSAGGKIIAGKQAKLNTASLNNSKGSIDSDSLDLKAVRINNSEGAIRTNKQLKAQIKEELKNRNGLIGSSEELLLNAEGESKLALNNSEQGKIIAGKQAVIHTATVDNNSGSIDTDSLDLIADSVNNTAGAIRTNKLLRAQINQLLLNQNGQIRSAENIDIHDNHKNTLGVDNTNNGQILAGNDLSLQAKNLSHSGVMASGHDAVIYLSENSDVNADISANANLKLHSDGKITNSHSLTGGDSVIVEASQIENQTGGSIQSNRQTELSAVDNIVNRGLINSNGLTLIQAGNTVDNVGTGRIYGNHVAIGTSNLFNREETKGNETKAAVIAARERLDIGAINIVNKEEGLITSEGDIGIGGKLDARLQATGMANSLINSSARIEAKGNGSIAVNDLRNFNNHFALEEYLASKQHIQQYKFPKLTDFLTEGIDGHFDERKRHNKHAIFIYKNGNYIRDNKQSITWRDFTRSTYKQRVKESKPGEIIVGGDLNISGQYWENNNSKILVGENLLGSENIQLNNIESKGKQTIIDDGWIGGFKNSHKKYKRKNTGKINNHSITDTDLEQPVSIIQQHVNISINQNKADSADFNKRQIDNSGSKNSEEESKNQLNYNQQKTASDNGLLSENKSTGSINNIQGNNQQQVNNSNEQADLPKFKTINSFNNQLPNNSLYHVDPNNKGYLVETDPAFTNMRKWLGSDYMLNSLGQDPEKMQKRLGDGYYEQRLINEQIAKLTGFRRLNGYYDDEDEFKALMDSGISVAKKLGLVPGVALTADQIARLTSDIVWLVDQTITLPDGTQQTVLVPQVYLMVRDGDLNTSGALISAANIRLHTNKDINNQGTIAGRKIVDLGANNFDNSGLISGQKVGLEANNNINIIGGTVQAQDLLSLQAKHIDINTTTVTHGDERNGGTVINRVAGLYVTGNNNGIMAVNGIEGLNVNGANIVNTSTNGLSQLASSKGNVNLGTVQTASHIGYGALNAKNHLALDHADEIGTQFMVTNDAQIIAGNQVNVRQADINSNNGNISIYGKEGVNITEGRKLVDMDESYYSKSKKFLSTKKSIDKYQLHQDEAVASNITAKNVNIGTEKDLNIRGSNIISDNQTLLQAGHDINVEAAVNQYQKNEYHARKKSGLMSSGGLGFTIGSLKETDNTINRNIIHSGTSIGSLNGNTTIIAGNHYIQAGSSVSSPNGDVTIAAKQIDINATNDIYSSDNLHTYKQSGLTLAVNVPVINSIQSASNAIEKVGKSKNIRVNAMSALNAGMDTYKAGQVISDIATNPQKSADVGVSITVGQQKNRSENHSRDSIASPSQIFAGGAVNLLATGAGKNSNINILGSDISGSKGTHLQADNDVNLLGAEQSHNERSSNKSSGWNAGVAINYGSNGFSFGVTAGANAGKGNSRGDETSYRNSHIGSNSGQTSISSGGTTNIKGAQVTGKGVSMDAAELNIASLQDKSKYKSKQQNVNGKITVGYGVSGTADYSQSKIKANYASVTEQSGIIAGDDGYQLNIKGNTDLKGAIITSSRAAEASGKNRLITGSLTSSDIHNHSDYKGSSFGISVNGGLSGSKLKQNPPSNNDKINLSNQGSTEVNKSFGFGQDSGHTSGDTYSGINTANILITNATEQQQRTGKTAAATIAAIHTDVNSENYAKNAGYLVNNFDKIKVQKELDLQREVTQEFDQNRHDLRDILHAVADNKRQNAEDIRKKNYIDGKNGYNTNESLALEDSADSWDKAAFYTDMALGTLYGYGDSTTLVLTHGESIANPAIRAATRPIQIWEVKCIQDSLYCSNNGFDDKKRPIDADSLYAEIGDKRQIFDIKDIKPGENSNVITISNPGILNSLNDSLKNAVKQNEWKTSADGIYVVSNPMTGNYLSEGLYVFYDKVNDLLGGRLPLTNSEKANIEIYKHVKDKGYLLDISSHSRGGLTASNALQNANRNGLTGIPIREARFFGTATYVPDYANQLVLNGFEGSQASSAVHYSDFVGRSPLAFLRTWFTMGGNSPTGGVEDKWFMYSHSSYFGEIPNQKLIDEKGRNIDANGNLTGERKNENPYFKDFNDKWIDGPNHNLNKINPSKPILVKPTLVEK